MIVPFQAAVSDVSAVPMLDVTRANQPLKSQFMEAMSAIFDSGQFIGGPRIKQLETQVAQASDAQFGIGCASGSDALLLALLALGIGQGDEVICPSFTFFATASAVVRVGATPVFVDIEPATFNLDTHKVAAAITPNTKAIIPVHLFGQSCSMDPILGMAREHGLYVIEDCAQSIGASDKSRRVGGIGDVGCFSFYPTKNIGGCGDGGMLTANNEELAERLRLFANHGMSPRYYHQVVGINSRLDAMQAAILSIKMEHLDTICQLRVQHASYYQELLSQCCFADRITVPQSTPGNEHVWNQFTIRIKDGSRDQVRQNLAASLVGSEVYYPVPLHQQACFSNVPVQSGSLPETERACREVLSLPMFPELTRAEQEFVVDALVQALA